LNRDINAVAVDQRTRNYRYRTTVLVGSWRPTREAAIEDAIKAKQAARGDEDEVNWIVPGKIEESEG
jgi:hypothetical protein